MTQVTVEPGTELIIVEEALLGRAIERVIACQHCSNSVTRPFKAVLIETFGAESEVWDYVAACPARCPSCAQQIDETTFVRCEGEDLREYEDEFMHYWSEMHGDEAQLSSSTHRAA